MSLNVWIKPSGPLATLQEGLRINNLQLPVQNDDGVKYTKISGELPAGLWLSNNSIVGTPYEVQRDTVSTFCIRASKNGQISDRTFSITVSGADDPVLLTPAGLLDVGPYKQLYVVDNSSVNYQLEAIDNDIVTGQKLTYFISSGELPPGLAITTEGVIYGVVKSVTTLKPAEGNGSYDHGYYDVGPFDFASQQRQNGYDQIGFDYLPFDYYFINQPRTLNRFYEFVVSVTDGETIHPARRKYQIYVVSANYFRADSESLVSNLGIFTADVSYVQAPVWLTPSDLGTFRANNYITLILDVFDTSSIIFELAPGSVLPPNMQFDPITGEIFGRVPAQPAITKTYSFTVTAIRFGDPDTTETIQSSKTFTLKIIGEIDSVIKWNTLPNLGEINAGYPSLFKINATTTITNAEVRYEIINGELPPGLSLAYDGEIIGSVSQFSSQISFDNSDLTFDNNTTTFNKSNLRLGLTSFDLRSDTLTTFDNNATTIDRTFMFTVEASDQYRYSALSQTFTIHVNTPNLFNYSNIYVKPYMTPVHRSTWSKFIDDPSIFTPNSIYRPYDPTFGIQSELGMLIYAGIKTKEHRDYSSLINQNIKRFHFGEIKKATAYYPGTKVAVYEIIYVSMIDPQLYDTSYNQDNITKWRSDIDAIDVSRWDYLPLWMRSVQPDARKPLGFVLGVPLCFCKVGLGDSIILNIKHSNFDFKLLDYTIDRFIINKLTGYDADKYIIFNKRNLL